MIAFFAVCFFLTLLDWEAIGALAIMSVFFLFCSCKEMSEGPKSVAPAASGSAAASDQPTPEKIAGVEYGTVRLCVVPKGGITPDVVAVKVAPMFIEGDPAARDKEFSLKKGKKGYCDFVHPDFSRFWGNFLHVTTTNIPLDEVGVYYLKDWKENPAGDSLAYAKAVMTKDGEFALGVLIASATVPLITITVKE